MKSFANKFADHFTRNFAALLCTAAVLSTDPALACGRGYSVGHAYQRATPRAITRRNVSPRVAAPDGAATEPAAIQSRGSAAPTSAL